jgi:hypothetical protein
MLDYYKKQGVIWQGVNKAGKVFTIYGDAEELPKYVASMMRVAETPIDGDGNPTNPDEDDDDYYDGDEDENSLRYAHKDTDRGRFTQAERDANLAELQAIVDDIQKNGWMPQFLNVPRKKDGSLAKGRVTRLWRGYTFQRYWEDSYGFNAPELSMKSLDDYAAVLEYTSRVVGY